jgi:hypothetical protein
MLWLRVLKMILWIHTKEALKHCLEHYAASMNITSIPTNVSQIYLFRKKWNPSYLLNDRTSISMLYHNCCFGSGSHGRRVIKPSMIQHDLLLSLNSSFLSTHQILYQQHIYFSCLVLSCPVLSCPVLSCPNLIYTLDYNYSKCAIFFHFISIAKCHELYVKLKIESHIRPLSITLL